MKNNLKYKNKLTIFGKLRKKFHELTNWNYTEIFISKTEISLESYKYLYKHLVKINKAFNGNVSLTLNKTKVNGDYVFLAVISLKVSR
jgi:hypothetical protein